MAQLHSIRAATAADVPLLGPLERRSGQRFRDSVHPYCADLNDFDPVKLAELQRAGSVWVAVDAADQPVGFAIAGQLSGEAYLHELDVEEPYGRQGIGRALVRRVAGWAKASGYRSLLLSTFGDVPWNAPLYARLGFSVVAIADYDDAMHAQRQSDHAAGLLLENRVIMRAPLDALLSQR